MSSDNDQMLESMSTTDLATLSIEDVRARRAAFTEVETGLSYLRRMVQGAADIITREQARRSGHDEQARGPDLVDELSDILGDTGRPVGVGRLSQTLEPTHFDTDLAREYDTLIGDGRLARVADLDRSDLDSLLVGLGGLEARVSAKRRSLLDQIDVLQAELTRRYQSGEASVDALLRDAT